MLSGKHQFHEDAEVDTAHKGMVLYEIKEWEIDNEAFADCFK